MFKALVEIPCFNNRCTVEKNGREVQSVMRLSSETIDGQKLPEPVYFCERGERQWSCVVNGETIIVLEPACEYRTRPVLVRETRGKHIIEDYRNLRAGKVPGKDVPEGYR